MMTSSNGLELSQLVIDSACISIEAFSQRFRSLLPQLVKVHGEFKTQDEERRFDFHDEEVSAQFAALA